MPTQTWPADLPQQFLVNGYQETFADNNIANQTARGPAILRPRTSSNVKPWRLGVVLHTWQVDVLENFYIVTLSKGVWPFNMPHPRKNNQPMLNGAHEPILGSEGLPILVAATALMRFVPGSPPVVTPITPVTFTAALTLHELP